MQTLPWIVASVASTLLAAALAAWAWQSRRPKRPEALPTDWQLTARPVFSADERRLYRALREALPHHVLLSKLPLVRFCEPTDPNDVRYWHDLLGASHVGFAICSANGRVLAAIDLDTDRSASRRVARIKHAALSACRVRYLRCAVDQLPSVAELQLLVPNAGAFANSPQPQPQSPPAPMRAPEVPATPGRAPRPMLWQDTAVFEDSFFPVEGEFDPSISKAVSPAAGRRASGPARPGPLRAASSFDTRRRPVPPTDFAPTRNSLDDADADDEPANRSASRPRFFSGSRS